MELIKKILIILGSLDRRIIFLIIGLSVLIPLLKPEWVNIPIRPRPESQTVFDTINNLNKGDKVVTMGGIIGKVSGFKEKGSLVTLKVDNNTTLTFNKSAIAGLSGEINQDDIE